MDVATAAHTVIHRGQATIATIESKSWDRAHFFVEVTGVVVMGRIFT